MQTVLGVILLIAAVFLIVVIMLQEGKQQGVTSAISGGSSDTFLGKTKGGGKDQLLGKLTMWVAIVFAVIAFVIYIIQPDTAHVDTNAYFNELNDAGASSASAETDAAEAAVEAAIDEAEAAVDEAGDVDAEG